MELPSLRTDRLRLDAPRPADAARVAELAGERAVALQTERIPHPYPEEEARAWVERVNEQIETGEAAVFAVRVADEGDGLVGVVGIDPEPEHGRAQLGYWVGVPYWGRGYATEAARAAIDWAFDALLDLRRIYARSFGRNDASCRVLEKLGMEREGRLRAHYVKWGEPVDVVVYGLLRGDR